MSDGRTFWYPQDARWLSWDAVIDLGEEFGPAAVAVLVCVTSEAKLQGSSWRVKVGLRTIARDAFVRDVDLVRQIVERAGEAGLLDDVEFDGWLITCRVAWMPGLSRRVRAQRSYQARIERLGGRRVDGRGLRSRIAFYGGLCWICREQPWSHIDHVKPISAGGPHLLANLRPACARCNQRKGSRWPFGKEMVA